MGLQSKVVEERSLSEVQLVPDADARGLYAYDTQYKNWRLSASQLHAESKRESQVYTLLFHPSCHEHGRYFCTATAKPCFVI